METGHLSKRREDDDWVGLWRTQGLLSVILKTVTKKKEKNWSLVGTWAELEPLSSNQKTCFHSIQENFLIVITVQRWKGNCLGKQ